MIQIERERKQRRYLTFCAVALLITYHLTLTTSCSSIDCPVQNTVAVNYGIVDVLGQTVECTDTIYIWTQRADGNDTLILNRGVNLSSFSLPMSYQHPEDMLVIYITDLDHEHETLDTIWLKKNDFPHFESVDCGTHFFHELTDVSYTRRGIDTISINNRNVNYDQTVTHLNICFKARQ